MDEKKQQEAYENYVKQKTPVHNLPLNMAKAFLTGGVICVIGEGILNWCEKSGIDKDISGGWVSLMLILLSVILTGFNIYPGIAKWGGAGALVPITGFANSVAAPAIEYQKEGQVMGIGWEDLYDRRSCDFVWNIYKLGSWTCLLGSEGQPCTLITRKAGEQDDKRSTEHCVRRVSVHCQQCISSGEKRGGGTSRE